MKKALIIIAIAIVGVAAWYLFFTNEGVGFSKETSIYKAVPMDAPVFFELKSIKSIPLDNQIAEELKKSAIFTPLFQRTSLLDSLVSSTKEIGSSVLNSPLVIAFTLEGKKNLVPLFILKAESNNKKNHATHLIDKLFGTASFTSSKRQYNGRKIVSYKSAKNHAEFHYTLSNGLLIASPKSILVEQAIRQMESESILDENDFTLVNKTASQQAKVAIYVNHSYFPLLLQNWLNPGVRKEVNELGKQVSKSYLSEIKKFGHYASWSELDLSVADDEIILNGVSYPNDSLKNFLSVFNGQGPIRLKADKYLPKKTAMFLSFGISNKKQFFEQLDTYLQFNELYYQREEAFKIINQKSGSDLEYLFNEILDDEMAVSFSELPTDPEKRANYFMVATKGQSVAKEQMVAFLNIYATKNKLDFNEMQSQFVVDKETKHPIYKFPYPSFPGLWLNGLFKGIQANYFAFWDNTIIFCNTQAGLESLIHDIMLDATLGKDIGYLKFKQNIENKANINFYFNPNLGFPIQKAVFAEEVSKKLSEKEDLLRKFGPVNWQVIHTNNLFFNNIYLKYTPEIKEDAKTTWQSNIGSTAHAKPQLAFNHNDLKNKEIIVQDDKNILHQITKDGRSRWAIQLSGKIMGQIFQIDYLRNGKYQYFFNTKDKFYLIDRDGNNVAPFPVALRAEASNGVNVFDYDNNKKYRYFVAGTDKKIYAYDTQGNLVSGWKFGTTDHLVTQPVQHFRVDNKDYIVFHDQSKIYIQDRRGETRVKLTATFENSGNELILDTRGGTSKIIASGKNGDVFYIYFNGMSSKRKLGNSALAIFLQLMTWMGMPG